MKRKSSKWAWREGEVDPQKEHIELRYGNAAETPYEKWNAVSLIGKPENNIFPVKWLMDPSIQEQRDIVNEARRELDFILIEVGGPDPWAYAIYHCNTSSNIYGRIHWSYFPMGHLGERHSSTVIEVSGEKYILKHD